MIYIYNSVADFNKQIQYVFNNIFSILGLEYKYFSKEEPLNNLKAKDVLIAYSHESLETYSKDFQNIIVIRPSNGIFSPNYLKKETIPDKISRLITKKDEGTEACDIISIFNDSTELFIKRSLLGKRIIETNIDIISDIFFMLTRYEEVVNTDAYKNERYNRFPAKESLAYKNNFIHRAVVNEHIDLMWNLINKMQLGYIRKKWWGDKEFAVCVSHDVDNIQKHRNLNQAIRSTGKLLIRNKRPVKAIYNFFNYLMGYKKDPYYTFDYLLEIEKKHNFKSSFYFMTGGTSEFDNRYGIKDKLTLKLIEQIEDSGCEVGYHCSFNTYDNLDMMKKEKNTLDEVVRNHPYGCRQHYLRFQAPITWRYYEKLGLSYDTTLAYADSEGFRCGICFPYKPYDLLENRIIDIWEMPLIVMEGSLQDPNYSAYTPQQGLEKTINLIETVKKHNGVFTLLYHNSSFDPFNDELDGWKEVYEQTMDYLGKSNCYGNTGKNIISIFNS